MFSNLSVLTVSPFEVVLLDKRSHLREALGTKWKDERPNVLFDAVNENRPGEVQGLIQHGMDPYTTNGHGNSAFHYAILKDRLMALEALLQFTNETDLNGLRFQQQNKAGCNIIQLAAIENNLLAANLIFKYSVPSEAVNSLHPETENSALHWAAISGNADLAKLLITKGVDIAIQNFQGETAFFKAVEKEDIEFLRSVLKFCFSDPRLSIAAPLCLDCPTFSDITPLHESTSRNNKKLVLLLLKFGAENKYDDSAGCPFKVALRLRRREIAQILLNNMDETVPEAVLEDAKELLGSCFVSRYQMQHRVSDLLTCESICERKGSSPSAFSHVF